MNIAVQFDKNYLIYAGVMMTSLCVNNQGHVELYVLNAALTTEDFDRLKYMLKDYDVTIHDLKVVKGDFDERLPVSEDWTIETYFVLKLSDLLPMDIERILFLDDDIIINGPIDELYNMEFNGMDILAAPDGNGDNSLSILSEKQFQMLSGLYGEDYIYFNSGVMLMNIKQIREKYNYSNYKEAMEQWDYELTAPDQDLLNYVHGGHVGYLDWKKYDLFAQGAHKIGMTYDDVKGTAAIVHFGGSKPWYSKLAMHFDIEKLWWDYARLTPYYEELASEFISTTLDNAGFENLINSVFEENGNLRELLNRCTEMLKRMK